MTGRSNDQMTASEVYKAVTGLMTGEGWVQVEWGFVSRVADAVGYVDNTRYGAGWDRFTARVRYALDKLAADTAFDLIKVPRGTMSPHGWAAAETTYYTQAAFDTAKAKAAQDQADRDALEARWTLVSDRLAAAGFALEPGHTLPISAWERLLTKAGW